MNSNWIENLPLLTTGAITSLGIDKIRQVLLRPGDNAHDVTEIQIGAPLGGSYRKMTFRSSREARPKLAAWCYQVGVKLAAKVDGENIPVGPDGKLVRNPVPAAPVCNVQGCGNAPVNGGLCEVHAPSTTPRQAACNVKGCDEPRAPGSGLCATHTGALGQRGIKVSPGEFQAQEDPRCTALTKSGERCKNAIANGSTLCHVHGKDGADVAEDATLTDGDEDDPFFLLF